MDYVAPDVHQPGKLLRVVFDQHAHREPANRAERQRENVAGELLGNARRDQRIQPGLFDGQTRWPRELADVAPNAALAFGAHRKGQLDEEEVAEDQVLTLLDDVITRVA